MKNLKLQMIAMCFWAVLHATVLAQDVLRDGEVAFLSGQGIVQAWYGHPAERYDHGILLAVDGGLCAWD